MTTALTDAERSLLQGLAASGGRVTAHSMWNSITITNLDDPLVPAQLVRLGFLVRNEEPNGLWYEITAAGRLALGAAKRGEAIPEAPAAPSNAEIAEAVKANRSLATVRIDEMDLDRWWEELDVECKADAFLIYTLGSGAVLVDAEERVPVEGAIGERVNIQDAEKAGD